MRVLLGVSGGIACYKAVQLLRLFQKGGHDVRVVMTPNATHFVAPLTFEALSGYPVYTGESDKDAPAINHIELAKWADIAVIAPATANTIAKLAMGIADNLLTSLLLAFTGKLFVFPAMNGNMYAHAATQTNIATLRARGVHVADAASGRMACGDIAAGRMPEPEEIFSFVMDIVGAGLARPTGLKILVTAGPTVEPIDPVRYVSNRSSGRMGYAIAATAKRLGAVVTLISGPTALISPVDNPVNVRTADEMRRAVEERVADCDILIMCAAVADYTPVVVAEQKIKKTGDTLTLELKKTADILKTVSAYKRPNQIFAGFAAESENLENNALTKLKEKNLDLIAANDISRADIGFNSPDNEVILYDHTGKTTIEKTSKEEVALAILDRLIGMYHQVNE